MTTHRRLPPILSTQHAGRRQGLMGDAVMVNRRIRVAIRFDDGRPEQWCGGPGPDGLCPPAGHGNPVACAGGTILALRGTLADGRRLTVGHGAGPQCPLAPLVRHAPAPWD